MTTRNNPPTEKEAFVALRIKVVKANAAVVIVLSLLLWMHVEYLSTDSPFNRRIATTEDEYTSQPYDQSSAAGATRCRFDFEDGGIVIFYHIPKTGGTTIRENLASYSTHTNKSNHFIVQRVITQDDMIDLERRIEDRLVRGRGLQLVDSYNNNNNNNSAAGDQEKDELKQTLFVELHGTIPGLPQLHDKLQRWRHLANEHQVSFLTFTVLRDPITFAISYFQHFRNPTCYKDWCELDLYNVTSEDDLLQSLIPNHQCQILLYGQVENKKQFPTVPLLLTPQAEQQCHDQVLKYLALDWDWVGTMEDLHTTTLPLLASLLLHDETIGEQMRAFNQGRYHERGETAMSRETLSEKTIAVLQEKSRLDIQLYEKYRGMNWHVSGKDVSN